MRRLALLLALLPFAAFAGPQNGTYHNAAGPSLEVQGATDQGFDFDLTAGAPDGATECPEGAVDCLHVGGHADLTTKFFTYIDPDDDTSRIFFTVGDTGIKLVSTTGPLGTGTGNRAAMVKLPGVYSAEGKQTGAAQTAAAQQTDAQTGAAQTVAPATNANAGATDQLVFFRSPTGNIACLFAVGQVTEVRCDMLQLNRSFTTPPKDCDLEWGDSFSVAEGERRGGLVCHGDTVNDPSAQMLDYGSSLSYGGIACLSAKSGVTCQNADGHGFFLSRKQQKVF